MQQDGKRIHHVIAVFLCGRVCTKNIQKCAAIAAAKFVSGPIHYEPNHATVSLDRIIEPFTADVTVTSRRLLEEQKKNKQ